MASADVELEQLLKERGKQLSHPSDSIDELLSVLDQVEKFLSKVDQSPRKSMLDALKPSMKALIQDNLSKHSHVDVKVAVASCISEITRITAPDAPYDDDQMREAFELIVSSFEDLADLSSRSFDKRASILETVSKVRSCVIMLDLECDELIVKMFEHFLRSVRDYHLESVYSSMENIMVLVIEESEEISVEMLKPLLASVKKDSQGVLPVARKLGEGVLLKSADKLKPYLMPAVTALGDTLDDYTKVVSSICEGTPVTAEQNDENESGLQPVNETKLEKESVDEAQQADESKITTASSDHADQVDKEEACPAEVDTGLNRSPKSIMSNGIDVTGDEKQASDVLEPSKKVEEDVNEEKLDNEDIDDSDGDKESKPEEETSKTSDKKDDPIANSNEPSDSSHVEGDQEQVEVEVVPEIEKESDVIKSEIEADKDGNDVHVSSPKLTESNTLSVESDKKGEKQDEIGAPPESGSPTDGTRTEKAVGQPETKGSSQEDASEAVVKEVKSPAKDELEDGEAFSDSEAKPLQKSESKSKSKSTKQTGKKSKQSGKKVDTKDEDSDSDAKPPAKDELEDGEGFSDSEAKPKLESKSKSKSTKQSGKKSKQSGKKVDVVESDPMEVDAKDEDSDSDAKPLKQSFKKAAKSKVTNEEDEEQEDESDSDDKPLKLSVKTGKSKKKDDKNVAENDQAKSDSDDDEMDSSPKSATKSATSSKRRRSANKDKVSDDIKYDKSLVGLKVKVWWPEDKTYYEGEIDAYYTSKKKHKVSYVDGEVEVLDLKTQKWKIIPEFSVQDEEQEQSTEAQSEEDTPETHKKKKSKTDSAKKVGGASSSGKSKGSVSKDNKSTKKTSGKSKEDEETPKTSGKSKANGPTKSKSTPESTKEKSTESPKSGSKKRKKKV